jgi:hypothetical protein
VNALAYAWNCCLVIGTDLSIPLLLELIGGEFFQVLIDFVAKRNIKLDVSTPATCKFTNELTELLLAEKPEICAILIQEHRVAHLEHCNGQINFPKKCKNLGNMGFIKNSHASSEE